MAYHQKINSFCKPVCIDRSGKQRIVQLNKGLFYNLADHILHLKTRVELVMYAIKNGIVQV